MSYFSGSRRPPKPLHELIAKASDFVLKGRNDGPITKTEQEIVAMLTEGATDKVIARSRGTSPHTVQYQIDVIKHKLGAKTRAQLVALWLKSKS